MTLFDQKIVAVVPAFNEANTIAEVIRGIKASVDEVIVVDDGSNDDTGGKAKEAGAILITHSENKGYDAAISDGFIKAADMGADIIVTFDADGQHLPSEIQKITTPLILDEADLVVGERPNNIRHFIERILGAYTNFKFGIKDPLCGLKAYKRKVYECVGHFDTINSIGSQLVIEALNKGFKFKSVPIAVKQRIGRSHFYFSNLRGNYKVLKALIKIIKL